MCDNYSVRGGCKKCGLIFYFERNLWFQLLISFLFEETLIPVVKMNFWIYKNSNSRNNPIQFNTIYDQVSFHVHCIL
jgi:hypothetical protein